MRRFLVNGLAVMGALTLFGIATSSVAVARQDTPNLAA